MHFLVRIIVISAYFNLKIYYYKVNIRNLKLLYKLYFYLNNILIIFLKINLINIFYNS